MKRHHPGYSKESLMPSKVTRTKDEDMWYQKKNTKAIMAHEDLEDTVHSGKMEKGQVQHVFYGTATDTQGCQKG